MSNERDDVAAVAMVPGRKPGVYVVVSGEVWGGRVPEWGDTAAAILDRIAIEAALAALSPVDRAVMELLYAYRCPVGYRGYWPASVQEIGRYLGETFPEFDGRPVPPRRVWRRHAAILATWHGEGSAAPTRRAA